MMSCVTKSRGPRMRKLILPIIYVSASLVVATIQTASASAPYPKVMVGPTISYAATNQEGYGGDVAYGVAVSQKSLYEGSTTGVPNPMVVSCSERVCFGLAIVGSFQYPVMSLDGRKSWRNGGHWFAGAWADAAGFVSKVTVFDSSEAIAWEPGQNAFYVTSCAGREWYSGWTTGEINSVASSNGGKVMVMRVMADAPSKATRVYRSVDGGVRWSIDP